MQAVVALKSRSKDIPITTVDLGNAAATEMAGGGLIRELELNVPLTKGSRLLPPCSPLLGVSHRHKLRIQVWL